MSGLLGPAPTATMGAAASLALQSPVAGARSPSILRSLGCAREGGQEALDDHLVLVGEPAKALSHHSTLWLDS